MTVPTAWAGFAAKKYRGLGEDLYVGAAWAATYSEVDPRSLASIPLHPRKPAIQGEEGERPKGAVDYENLFLGRAIFFF